MSTDDSAEKIRRRMAELRRELECDVREVSRGARVITDWKFYARQFPWAVAGAAVVAGFMLVPKRKPVIKPDPEMIAELIKQKKIKVESVTKQPDKPGMLKSLIMMGLTYAVRTAAQQFTQQMAATAQQKAREGRGGHGTAEHHDPGPSPLQQPWSSSTTNG
jgi:hypothetical protein